MNIKFRAVLRTAAMLAFWIIVPFLVIQLFQALDLSLGTVKFILASVLFGLFVWIIYVVNLGQLKTEEAYKKSSEIITDLQQKLSK